MLNLLYEKEIKIVDTLNGGICVQNNKLIFILVPREDIIKTTKNYDYIKALKKIELLNCNYKSYRGENKKVYFETENTNYINLGIGTCRGKRGLYLRENKKISEKILKIIENYNKVTHHICEKFIPTSLLNSLSKSMKLIYIWRVLMILIHIQL